MTTTAKLKVKDAYTRLINLNMTELMANLHVKDVITSRQKEIIQNIPLNTDQMEYLLDKIIIPDLEGGKVHKFKLFLEVLEESDNPVANSVGRRLGVLNFGNYIMSS